MRLPVINDEYASIDEPEATRMLHYAIDHGVNYVDTAYNYHGKNSERFLGRALKDGYREKVKLVTKLHPWHVDKSQDFDRLLNEQLEKLQTDYVDVYLLHGLWKAGWHKIRDMGVLRWAEGAMADGHIKHLGFSFHDSFPVFKEIVDAYDHWAMCQIQYNFMNEDVQAGTKGLQYAAEKELAVVIMEPLRGGLLANPPGAVQEIWDRAKRNPVDTALQWLWNKPEISIVLSGMSTMEHVRQNVESAGVSGVGTLLQDGLDLIVQVRDKYNEFRAVPCTKCRYCMPCPHGVDIPRNFELYNENVVYNALNGSALERGDIFYFYFLPESQRASVCVACRECEEKCPQQIKISEWMPRIHKALVNQEVKTMFTRILGKSGIQVSAMGLGCWAIGGPFWHDDSVVGYGQVDDAESIRAIHCALDMGVTFFDTSDAYGCGHSETILGQALKGRRDQVVIATKFGYEPDKATRRIMGEKASPEYIQRACEASLRRLGTDCIDLYQFHIHDYDLDKAPEVRDALEQLVKGGKIRFYGWSTIDPERVRIFAEGAHFVAVQFGLNLFVENPGMVDVCEELDLGCINRGPLAMGILTDKYNSRSTFPDDDMRHQWNLQQGRLSGFLDQRDAVRDVLMSNGRTLPQGALAWIWARSERAIPIPGFKTVAQVEENVKALEFGPLNDEQMRQIDEILGREPVTGE